ncbi:MAG: hypothetical protein ACQ9MH_16500 [Nitrospinales bacterium]
MEDILTAHPDFKAMFSADDKMILGELEALWQRNCFSTYPSKTHHTCEGFIPQNFFATKTPRHEV